jgi:tetratricopeptide (TPR) repeat protein
MSDKVVQFPKSRTKAAVSKPHITIEKRKVMMLEWIEHYERGKYEFRHANVSAAAHHLRKANELVDVDSDPLLAGALFMRLSSVEMLCHNLDEARRLGDKAIRIAEQYIAEPKGKELLAASGTILAGVIAVAGEEDEAMLMLQQLIARIQNLGAPELAADPIEALADMIYCKRDHLQSEQLYKQAFELRNQSEPTSDKMLALLQRLEDVCDMNGHGEDAEKFANLREERSKRVLAGSGFPTTTGTLQNSDGPRLPRKSAMNDAILGSAIKAALRR